MDGLTIFTPTFNRAHTLPRLFDSLCAQEDSRFEWIIADDGSTDETCSMIKRWNPNTAPFRIRYYSLPHGGKQRAINFAVKKASFPFFFIVDSDDSLTPNAVSKVLAWCEEIKDSPHLAGVSGARGSIEGHYLSGEPAFPGTFVDISNLERAKYGLCADMAEIYKTAVLKQYPFPVWPGETFTPEAVIWNRIALDGYQIRWHKDIIYLCEYLEDGLTRGGYPLYLKNLMGCAMANDLRALTSKTVREKVSAIVETDVSCCLKGELGFLRKTNYPLFSYFLLPYSWLLSIYRRIKLFRNLL